MICDDCNEVHCRCDVDEAKFEAVPGVGSVRVFRDGKWVYEQPVSDDTMDNRPELPPPPPVPNLEFSELLGARDQGKNRMELLPPTAMMEVGKVLTHGARKHGANDWTFLFNHEQSHVGAALRHIFKYQQGDQYDKESGLPHLAHAVCRLLFVIDIEEDKT